MALRLLTPSAPMDSPLFYVILFVHVTSLIVGFGAVLVTDHFGLAWLREKVPFERLVKVAGTTQKVIWAGWGMLVISGIGLILIKGFLDNLTTVKVCCVALAGANGVALHLILKSLHRYETADAVPTTVMWRLAISMLVSQVAWWGAFIIGFLHRHVQSRIEWPSLPLLWPALFTAGIVALWLAGEWYLRSHPSRVKVQPDHEAKQHTRGPGETIDPLGKAE